MATHFVYRFHAELLDYTPKIWRRFEINGIKSMAELGYALMVLFEMRASHLFGFTYDYGKQIFQEMQAEYGDAALERTLGKDAMTDRRKVWRFELPSEDRYENGQEKWMDASRYRLKDITTETPRDFLFEYDYGDNWRVGLTLESCDKTEISASELPRVLEGAGFGIIEDCGGVGGLEELAKAFRKKKGAQYSDLCEWLGIDELDLTAFDLDDMNFRLKKLPRIFKECYEYGYVPTQRSIDLIERKYRK